MLPVSLENRAEEIFKEMGGLAAARTYFTEEEVTDICLFNGYTEVLFPFYKSFTGSLSNGLYDYKSLDLSLIDYVPSSYICVTDKYYKPLYNATVEPEVIDGKLSYYFGKSAADRKFLQSLPDGSLLLLVYKTATSPSIAQVIVSHKLPTSVIDLNRKLWEAELKKVSLETTSYGELTIKNSITDSITVFKREGSAPQGFSETDIVYDGESYTIAGDDIYLKFSKSAWVCFRSYTSYVEPDIYTIMDQQELQDLLESRGYSLTVNTPRGYVMSKPVNDEICEVSVSIEENNIVDSVQSAKYKKLSLENVTGDNSSYVTEVNGCYHFDIKQSHTQNNATKLITKSVFKIRSDLSYV